MKYLWGDIYLLTKFHLPNGIQGFAVMNLITSHLTIMITNEESKKEHVKGLVFQSLIDYIAFLNVLIC